MIFWVYYRVMCPIHEYERIWDVPDNVREKVIEWGGERKDLQVFNFNKGGWIAFNVSTGDYIQHGIGVTLPEEVERAGVHNEADVYVVRPAYDAETGGRHQKWHERLDGKQSGGHSKVYRGNHRSHTTRKTGQEHRRWPRFRRTVKSGEKD